MRYQTALISVKIVRCFRLHGCFYEPTTPLMGSSYHHSALRDLARSEGLEPPAEWVEATCSIQLSYERIEMVGPCGYAPLPEGSVLQTDCRNYRL